MRTTLMMASAAMYASLTKLLGTSGSRLLFDSLPSVECISDIVHACIIMFA